MAERIPNHVFFQSAELLHHRLNSLFRQPPSVEDQFGPHQLVGHVHHESGRIK
jgi:hypothetical protein